MRGSQDLLSFSYSIAGSASTGESLKRAHRSPPEDFQWVMFEMPPKHYLKPWFAIGSSTAKYDRLAEP